MVNTGSAFSNDAHNTYAYNDRREVTESKRFLGTDPQNPGSEVTAERREYLFDNIGNREEHTDGGGSAINYTANQLNQYTDISGIAPDLGYDSDGNLNAWDDGSTFWTYSWDGANRLISGTDGNNESVSFTYDYMGRRVKATFTDSSGTVEERYVWDGWTLLLVLDGSNNVVRKFTWGLDIAEEASGLPYGDRPGAAAGGVGGLLAVEESSGSESGDYVYFYDANGNVGQVLDWDTEAIAAHYEYDPFGRLISSSGSYADGNRFRFSTKYQDPITGFYYYGFRYMNPSTGRFLNRDPIGEFGAIVLRETKAIESNELNFSLEYYSEEESNLYAMVRNDPVNHFDYLGLFLFGCTPGPECCDGIYSCYSSGAGVKLRFGRILCNYNCTLTGVEGPDHCSEDDFPPMIGMVERIFRGDRCPLMIDMEREECP